MPQSQQIFQAKKRKEKTHGHFQQMNSKAKEQGLSQDNCNMH